MLAMKNSTAAAQAMGISLIKYRLLAFVICTAYAAISGVMLMVCMRAATASDGTGFYALITSLNILAAVIIAIPILIICAVRRRKKHKKG